MDHGGKKGIVLKTISHIPFYNLYFQHRSDIRIDEDAINMHINSAFMRHIVLVLLLGFTLGLG